MGRVLRRSARAGPLVAHNRRLVAGGVMASVAKGQVFRAGTGPPSREEVGSHFHGDGMVALHWAFVDRDGSSRGYSCRRDGGDQSCLRLDAACDLRGRGVDDESSARVARGRGCDLEAATLHVAHAQREVLEVDENRDL